MIRSSFHVSVLLLVLLVATGCTRTVRLRFVDAQTGTGLAHVKVEQSKEQGTFMEFIMILPPSTISLNEGRSDESGRIVFQDVPWEGQFSMLHPAYQYVEVGQTWPHTRYGPTHDLSMQIKAEVEDGFAIICAQPLRKPQQP